MGFLLTKRTWYCPTCLLPVVITVLLHKQIFGIPLGLMTVSLDSALWVSFRYHSQYMWLLTYLFSILGMSLGVFLYGLLYPAFLIL